MTARLHLVLEKKNDYAMLLLYDYHYFTVACVFGEATRSECYYNRRRKKNCARAFAQVFLWSTRSSAAECWISSSATFGEKYYSGV